MTPPCDLCTRPGSCEDDLLLEVVVLMGTACADEACSLLLAEAGLLPPLVDLLNGRTAS